MISLPASGEGAGASPDRGELSDLSRPVILSCFQARPLLASLKEGLHEAGTSLDLGLTTCQVTLAPEGVSLPSGERLSWESVEAVAGNDLTCFEIRGDEAVPIQRFSEQLNRFYALMPTAGAPTLLVSGIPMHRIQGTDPYRDTLAKVQTIAPLVGRVLDTCTGLGYTAIQAARRADEVVTIELDPAVLEVARLNPWSAALFGDRRIVQVVGDAFDEIESLEDGAFSRILHDPPMFSLAGDLYSGAFYRQLWRVLKRGGRLFHYIGDPDSRSGRNVAKGVVRRLQEAGFSSIARRPAAFGVVAYKAGV